MANQKSQQIHEIPLNTMELCLNKYKADIAPYVGYYFS